MIKKIETKLLEQHQFFFGDYFKHESSFLQQNPSEPGPARFKIVKDLDNEMKKAFEEISTYESALGHEQNNHANNKLTFDLLERSIIEEINFLSEHVSGGIDQTLQDDLANIAQETQCVMNTVMYPLVPPFDTGSGIEDQHLSQTAINKVLRLPDTFSFFDTLDKMDRRLSNNSKKRQQVADVVFTTELYALISTRLNASIDIQNLTPSLDSQNSSSTLSVSGL